MEKLKFKSDIFKSSNKSISNEFLYIYIFFIYIKMSKNPSAKYYQENKERLQEKTCEDIKIFLHS